ncbi:hypothetical protein WJX72_000996 [[Myrmecia] bisecta]|uniref:PDZ domain-containing protein n=1 Tax=[Myrmecia] bisecta TaxID=41462 RepID=A0AAW1PTJ0_9CHLO
MPELTQAWPVEEGSQLYTVSLSKPLGLVLAEQGKKVIVEKIADKGAAAKTDIQVGDVVRGTTARAKNTTQQTAMASEARMKQGLLGGLVLLNADGESFDTVMAAIDSSRCSQCDITLVLEHVGKQE